MIFQIIQKLFFLVQIQTRISSNRNPCHKPQTATYTCKFHEEYPLYFDTLTLSYDGGGALCAHDFLLIFLLKISPPDQTLRPTCKFLILCIFYHTIFFLEKFSI